MRGVKGDHSQSAMSGDYGDRLAADQVAAVFKTLPLGVLGAAVAAWLLALALTGRGALDWQWGAPWACYVTSCALAHLILSSAYQRAKDHDTRWQRWALWLSLICVFEGLGWGILPVWVAIDNTLDTEMLTLVVTLTVAAGATSVFSPYLPSFAAFFFPTTLPYAVWSAITPGTMHQTRTTLMILFVTAIFGLGVTASRSFKRMVALRMQMAALAEELRIQKETAEAANLSKSSFLAAASHDLRQPVHALGLFVGALRNTRMSKEGRLLVEQIEASTNAMDGLFSALLDISRLDAGIVEVHKRAFALGPFVERICRDHRAEAEAKGLSMTAHLSTAVVLTDPVLFERVLRNLVANAVRYTDRGRVVIGCRPRGKNIAVQVWDTGRGIPADRQQKIFEEYYQLDNPERDRAKGLGLGLAIVRRLTGLLEVQLTLRSQVERGSCFEIMIPRAYGAVAEVQLPEDPNVGALAQALIVVVDDEQAIREGMSTLLGGWGHTVIAAASGDEAVLRLSTHPVRPDLIICDYRLRGDERGIDVIERLQAEYNESIPGVLITGDTAPDRLVEARASGFLLLHKPVSNAKLRAAIVNLLMRGEPATIVEADPQLVK